MKCPAAWVEHVEGLQKCCDLPPKERATILDLIISLVDAERERRLIRLLVPILSEWRQLRALMERGDAIVRPQLGRWQ